MSHITRRDFIRIIPSMVGVYVAWRVNRDFLG
jgi:hypothetical protein